MDRRYPTRGIGRAGKLLWLLPFTLTLGCATLSPTERGMLGGGAIGGTAGAIIGKQLGNTAGGAAVGAGLGALAGGLTGNEIEQAEARSTAPPAFVPHPQAPLCVADVVQLAQQHVSDELIINQIRSTGSTFNLSAQDLVWMKQNGVSDTVVRVMQQTRMGPVVRQPSPNVAIVGPVCPPPPHPVYVVEPPPPVVRYHFGYTHRFR